MPIIFNVLGALLIAVGVGCGYGAAQLGLPTAFAVMIGALVAGVIDFVLRRRGGELMDHLMDHREQPTGGMFMYAPIWLVGGLTIVGSGIIYLNP